MVSIPPRLSMSDVNDRNVKTAFGARAFQQYKW